MFSTALGRFRAIAFAEGVSYILLLGIAMPLKYMADMPLAVKYVGWAHGLLFILYVMTLMHVWVEESWSFIKVTFAFVASLLPFGTFFLEYQLRKESRLNGS